MWARTSTPDGVLPGRSTGDALRVVDVDGPALVIMGVEQRQLLMAVDDVAGIVDVERHRLGLSRVGAQASTRA